MKKSLVIISFAFIFLLSVSIVSANFFDWFTGDITGGDQQASLPTSNPEGATFNPPLTLKRGQDIALSSDTSLTLGKVEGDIVTATVTDTVTGETSHFELQKGTNILDDGTQVIVSDVKSRFLARDTATISVSQPADVEGTTGTEGTTFSPPITQTIPFEAGEYTIDNDVWVLEGEGDTLTLTINGLYKADLTEGVYNIPALCTGNHVVTISGGVMNVDTATNTITTVASQF